MGQLFHGLGLETESVFGWNAFGDGYVSRHIVSQLLSSIHAACPLFLQRSMHTS